MDRTRMTQSGKTIIIWGAYDTSKPRVRLLLAALRSNSRLIEINSTVWQNVRDKSVMSKMDRLKALFRMVLAYPMLIFRYLAAKRGALVVLPYPGYLEAILISPFAWLRRDKIVLDVFISLYDTIVLDRQMLQPGSILAKLLFQFERLSVKRAHILLTDTHQHADFFARTFNVPPSRFHVVPVGAEDHFWQNHPIHHPLYTQVDVPVILFYGQMIPLHGIQTILEAILHLQDQNIFWLIIGAGQKESLVQEFMDEHQPKNVLWIPWVTYEELPAVIHGASICLGIFGTSAKSARVIPNKVYQCVACGKPIVTRDSEAVRYLFGDEADCVRLIEPGSAKALAEAILSLITDDACKGHVAYSIPPEKLRPDESIVSLLSDL